MLPPNVLTHSTVSFVRIACFLCVTVSLPDSHLSFFRASPSHKKQTKLCTEVVLIAAFSPFEFVNHVSTMSCTFRRLAGNDGWVFDRRAHILVCEDVTVKSRCVRKNSYLETVFFIPSYLVHDRTLSSFVWTRVQMVHFKERKKIYVLAR